MAIHLQSAARDTAIIIPPRIGALVLGRKRPGFDPAWGADMKRRILGYLAALPYPLEVPSENIADENSLRAAVERCRVAGVTVMVVVQPTISDGRLAPLLSRLWDGTLLMWATPEKPTGRMISANSLVGTHAMSATLRQMHHPLELVYGDPDDEETRQALHQSLLAIHGAASVQRRVLGLVGTHAPGFVDFHADPVFLDATLGSQLYHLGTVELLQRVRGYSEAEIAEETEYFRSWQLSWSDDARQAGTVSDDGTAELAMQARYYRALRGLMEENSLDTLAFRCWPDLPSDTGHWPYLALARLVSEGFPVAMEGDVDGTICGRIVESVGVGPVYLSDWLHHDRETITIWHTGAAPFQMASEPGQPGGPELSVQFNNKLPTVVQSTIRGGMPATLFRIWRFDEEYHLCVLEGETETPDRELMATNGVFRTAETDVRRWFEEQVQRGMPHHVCIIEGHHAELIRRIGRLLGMVGDR